MNYCSIAPCKRFLYEETYCLNHWHDLVPKAKRSAAPYSRQSGFTTKDKRTEYNSWHAMLYRCYEPSAKNYKWYGGRGIGVCESWVFSFKAFFEDMGFKPSAKHSIDRINPDGHYEPSNCRWATAKEQANNKRGK